MASASQGAIVGISCDVAAKSHRRTFRPKCLLSLNASDERQMRSPHGLAKLASWQLEAAESPHLPWGPACLIFGVTKPSFPQAARFAAGLVARTLSAVSACFRRVECRSRRSPSVWFWQPASERSKRERNSFA
jgi:hypothetical protein